MKLFNDSSILNKKESKKFIKKMTQIEERKKLTNQEKEIIEGIKEIEKNYPNLLDERRYKNDRKN